MKVTNLKKIIFNFVLVTSLVETFIKGKWSHHWLKVLLRGNRRTMVESSVYNIFDQDITKLLIYKVHLAAPRPTVPYTIVLLTSIRLNIMHGFSRTLVESFVLGTLDQGATKY